MQMPNSIASSLQIERVLLQVFEREDVERGLMRRGEHDLRSRVGCESLLPTGGTETPLIARLEPRKTVGGLGCREVIAAPARELEERSGHARTDDVTPDILSAGVAAAVAKEAGQRPRAA